MSSSKTLRADCVTLSDGQRMPMIGLGCFFGPPNVIKEEDSQRYIEQAIATGYRHLDTAWVYKTEVTVGRALRNAIKQGLVKREDVFVTSKLGWGHHHPDDVKDCVRDSLKNLGLNYVDMYLIHWPHAVKKPDNLYDPEFDLAKANLPYFEENDLVKVWKKLEECVAEGLIKSIGISNFNARQVKDLTPHCRIVPAVNQVEIHLYHQNVKLTEVCKERGILMVGYTPLGQPDPAWQQPGWVSPLKDPVVAKLAEKYKKSPAQISLRYFTQKGIILVPSSTNKERQANNLDVFDFKMSDEDLSTMLSLDKNRRNMYHEYMKDHKDYPFHDPY